MAAPGTLIADRYRLVRQLGAGGMGVVWEARDERLDRPVAVKQLRTQLGLTEAETEVIAQRAMREARINASLQHPYAVSVFDVVQHDGQPCIVMELVPSVPLTEVMRGLGTLAPAEAARVGSQVASALAAAHALGIVHRDVKPGNVLIGDDGTARICDFGISRSFGDATLTMTGMITGTPAYLAPETARGEESTFASDVHSLGATLYAAVEGEPPFGNEGNAIAVLYRVTAGEMRPAQRAGDLEPLLLSMMSLEPSDRPTMAQAAAQLAALTGGATEAARSVSAPASPAVPQERSAQSQQSGQSGQSEQATAPFPAPTRALTPTASSAASPATRALPGGAAPGPQARGRSGATADTPRLPLPAPAPTRLPASGPPAASSTSAPPRDPAPAAASGAAASAFEPPARTPAVGAPAPRSRRGLVVAIVVLALLVAAVGGALLWPTLDRSAVDAGSTPGPSGPTSSSAPSPSSSPSASSEGEPTTEQLAQAVSDYYALLPDDTDAGWQRLTPAYQRQTGGFDSYEEFWKDLDSVTATDVRATAPDRVVATLTYVAKSGNRRSTEQRSFRLVRSDGILKIDASAIV